MKHFYNENPHALSQVIISVERLLNQCETKLWLSYSHEEEEESMGFK